MLTRVAKDVVENAFRFEEFLVRVRCIVKVVDWVVRLRWWMVGKHGGNGVLEVVEGGVDVSGMSEE